MLTRHVGLLEIKGENWRLTPIPLKNVRPFLFQEVVLADQAVCTTRKGPFTVQDLSVADQQSVVDFLNKKIDEMINKAREESTPDLDIRLKLPLIRLRVLIKCTTISLV